MELSLVADNVAQATGATILSLQRGVFAGMRALDLAGYRWALPRISSFCCFVSFKFHCSDLQKFLITDRSQLEQSRQKENYFA